MAKTIRVELSKDGVSNAIKELQQYKLWVETKERELRQRLAEKGAEVARIQFTGAKYDGTNDVVVRVDNTGSVAVIYAEGQSVAFIEFGSGARYGYGHPQASEFGVGPGTYPTEANGGKGWWDNPSGWWYAHGKHSYGNPPSMSMYKAVQAITEQVTMIAREVFGSA